MQTLYDSAPFPVPEPEINTTPLIDVMLVLLVMLLITIPAATHSINLDLPGKEPAPLPRSSVYLEIDFDGTILWNGEVVPGLQRLEELSRHAARQAPQPDIRIAAHRRAKYDAVAQAMAVAQRSGLRRLGLVRVD